ncbi:hypothetical protein Vadar_030058 [Vaccinium darrowii]|uniref:Uncharacterized protein n=1 Tax=Vaccinium darrowii TaxID=229202 RepID=A0ACB7YH27_9ERIC|nr:hypothetical protein Vadar_030058 [Vaccinium darrowii]
MLKFPPSLLAAAAIFTAQCSLNRYCSRLMVTYHQKAGTGKLTGVYKKYSSRKFGSATNSEPAQFLLDL